MKATKLKLLALAACLAGGFGQQAAADLTSATDPQTEAMMELKPIIIADKVDQNLSLISDFETFTADEPMVIHRPGASFLKVHFKNFDIPEGAYVEVSNPDGTEVYRYGKTIRSAFTEDAEAGDNGETSFSSMSISGDKVLLSVKSDKVSLTSDDYKVDIDYVLEGFPQEQIDALIYQADGGDEFAQTFSTCGNNERRDAVCYKDSHPTEYERTRPVARLLIGGGGLCTAWRVSSDNRVFTNNHCVASESGVRSSEVWFNYQNTSCGRRGLGNTTKVSGDRMLKTNNTLDYTLLTVRNFDSIEGFGYYGLDPRVPDSQERMYIPQHGSGNPKELAIESDQNRGNVCRVDYPTRNGRGRGTDTGYMCDTIGGSSGSPVLSAESNKVIALHHFGGCPNQGVQIAKIWPQVEEFFDGVPDGDNGGGDNPGQAPSAGFRFNASGLTVTFSNTSSDSDGSIASYEWDFGDGDSSSTANPTHTYDRDGTYTVSLTVTDDDGLTDTVSRRVEVEDDTGGGDPGDVELTATKGSFWFFNWVTLNWRGIRGNSVDIYRDGQMLRTNPNSGRTVDWQVPAGNHTYKVCLSGSDTVCSAEVSVDI